MRFLEKKGGFILFYLIVCLTTLTLIYDVNQEQKRDIYVMVVDQ